MGKDGYPLRQKYCLPDANAYKTEPLSLSQFHTLTFTSRYNPITSHNDRDNSNDNQTSGNLIFLLLFYILFI